MPEDARFPRSSTVVGADEECPATEPDPLRVPPRGVALSVLWWLDDGVVVIEDR